VFYNVYVHELLNPAAFVKDFGYAGIFLTILIESGVFFGFFLPGDSLLFSAGLLASQGLLNIYVVIILSIAGAILGNNIGYYTGKRLDKALFTDKDSFWFSRKRVREAHAFFEKKGAQSLILARFIPAVRTFLPIAAGIGEMPYRDFFKFNAIGGILWGTLLPALGYSLGKTVPNIDKYLLPAILVIIIASALPVVIPMLKKKFAKQT
jgi:membrane-associated protein